MHEQPMISLTLTQAAIKHIKSIMAQKKASIGFRISMKKYGCNGFGYVPEIVEVIEASDLEITSITELRVFVDRDFAQALNGTIIDYVSKGIGQSHLSFNNPNAEGECGCGESVNLKEKANDQ